jgi:hypothetical protein
MFSPSSKLFYVQVEAVDAHDPVLQSSTSAHRVLRKPRTEWAAYVEQPFCNEPTFRPDARADRDLPDLGFWYLDKLTKEALHGGS